MTSFLESIGKWPVDGEEVRRRKQLVRITPDRHFHMIHGEKQHVLVSLIVSNDYMSIGLLTIPPNAHSELETHAGDEALLVLHGKLVVRTVQASISVEQDRKNVSHICYQIDEQEKCLIPEGTRHQYINFTDDVVKVFFSVAPRL